MINESKKTNNLVLLMIFNQILVSFILVAFNIFDYVDDLVLQMLLEVLFFAFPAITYMFLTKKNIKSTIKFNKISSKEVIYIFLATILIKPVLSFFALVSSAFFPNAAAEMITETLNGNIVLAFLSVAVFPPICEELFFRGAVFTGLKKQPILKACILSGFFFAIAHMNGNQLIYTLVGGIFFSYLMYITNSIIAPIFSHFIINGSQFIESYYAIKMLETTEQLEDISNVVNIDGTFFSALFLYGTLSFFCIILLIKLLGRLKKINEYKIPKDEYAPKSDENESEFNISFFIIIAVYIMTIISTSV